MQLSRRTLLASAPALLFAARERLAGVTVGVTDWDLRQTGRLEAVALASSLGFDAVEVSLGRKPVDGKLPMDNAELQAQYIAEAKKHNIALAGTCLDILHV
ncbi:MAG TPA: sugar phosphate isomerase/epimerase, partial [Bryobacteraceae bacterium]|nr:sugar phosphate isomerase/epimerase [Bryobacteraceae bacterium]